MGKSLTFNIHKNYSTLHRFSLLAVPMIVAINKIDKAEADIVSFDKNLLHFPVQ